MKKNHKGPSYANKRTAMPWDKLTIGGIARELRNRLSQELYGQPWSNELCDFTIEGGNDSFGPKLEVICNSSGMYGASLDGLIERLNRLIKRYDPDASFEHIPYGIGSTGFMSHYIEEYVAYIDERRVAMRRNTHLYKTVNGEEIHGAAHRAGRVFRLGDAKMANRRVSVSLEDSLRGILDDIDADGIGSQVRDYVDERIGLGADLIATSEKYGVDPERLRELKERVSDWYERIYDSYDNVPGYQEAIDAGDALIRSHAPYVDALIEYRGDMLSSDREVAALAFAMDELGLASGGSAYGSRKLVRKALSGGTYNVTYGEGFETHSMRGVDVERVADFLEQEARFLRMNTPGRDYLMTIQIQRVD